MQPDLLFTKLGGGGGGEGFIEVDDGNLGVIHRGQNFVFAFCSTCQQMDEDQEHICVPATFFEHHSLLCMWVHIRSTSLFADKYCKIQK